MKLEQLTFTRYIAALSVVFFHYGAWVFPANIPWLNPILAAGPIAVSYFYVLSGFIMAIATTALTTPRPLKAALLGTLCPDLPHLCLGTVTHDWGKN